ncbi:MULTISPECIES: mycothiol synthase [Aestuariimicrobium]|uniref:mycothiol synthase n=1 Tax=Aestuariimicrobium TaxID=396388 RepID=UPI0003B359DF|nr:MULTISPECIES: mycothiol synthase [Aestuariimicrobium]CAI9405358.1 Mycothiol acetyltransferase [Aestuariimicrobium sp. T2.26MG-19.2B]
MSEAPPAQVRRLPHTDGEALRPWSRAVHEIVERAVLVDGVAPVNELGRMALHGKRAGVHWLASDSTGGGGGGPDDGGHAVLGWAWLDPADSSVQLVVHPDHRGRGIGTALAEAVVRDAHPHHWWSFGTLPAAAALAAHLGLHLERQLLIMVRDLIAHPQAPPEPLPGVELVPFTPDLTADLVRINAAAFAHHPEQGAMTVDDVAARVAEPWFDPEGLLFARDTRTEEFLGFHWTKLEEVPGRAPVGEVYVLGVHPDVHSRGLGRHLLAAGLAHLQSRGAEHVHLYVEADQTRVVQLYDSASFEVHNRDSSYA